MAIRCTDWERTGSQSVHGTATYMCDDTRGCIIQFCPPDDEHMCSKHVEAWNKLIIKFSASSWLILFLYCTLTEDCTLTEVFPCLSLSCKANARVKLAKMGHGPHSSQLVICVIRLLFVFFCVLFVCVCCTTATGCQPKCCSRIYHITILEKINALCQQQVKCYMETVMLKLSDFTA